MRKNLLRMALLCGAISLMPVCVTGCQQSTEQTVSDTGQDNDDVKELNIEETAESPKETEPSGTKEEADETSAPEEDEEYFDVWYADNPSAITNGIYFAGEDIAPDNYILHCDESEWGTSVAIFETSDKFDDYLKSNRSTMGEEAEAIEKNALTTQYLSEGEDYALNVKAGYVVMIENGNSTLRRADEKSDDDPSEVWRTGHVYSIYSGMYFGGDDFEEGHYMLTCLESEYGLDVRVFNDREAYDTYINAERSTMGEEAEALRKNATTCMTIEEGESCYVNLKEGSVIVVDGGSGKMETVKLSWQP